MTVLILSRVTLPPGERGNAEYTRFVIDCLQREGHEVHVRVSEGCVPTPEVWDMPPTPEEIAFFRGAIEQLRPEALFVNYTFLCTLLDFAPASCLRAVITHDARHLRCADFLRQGLIYESTPWTEEQERDALSRTELILAIQDREAEEFRKLAPSARIELLPCCFPIEELPTTGRADSCLFVGSDADHNLIGVRWFLQEVWSGVLERFPGASLDVCGSVKRRLACDLPGVTLHGQVNDLTPFYTRNSVCVVPLLAGSGCKLKLVEALSKGRSCVSTSCGASGLGPKPPGVLVADSPKEFREALFLLFADPGLGQELGRAGLEFAARHFDAAAHASALDAVLRDMLQQRRGAGAVE